MNYKSEHNWPWYLNFLSNILQSPKNTFNSKFMLLHKENYTVTSLVLLQKLVLLSLYNSIVVMIAVDPYGCTHDQIKWYDSSHYICQTKSQSDHFDQVSFLTSLIIRPATCLEHHGNVNDWTITYLYFIFSLSLMSMTFVCFQHI